MSPRAFPESDILLRTAELRSIPAGTAPWGPGAFSLTGLLVPEARVRFVTSDANTGAARDCRKSNPRKAPEAPLFSARFPKQAGAGVLISESE